MKQTWQMLKLIPEHQEEIGSIFSYTPYFTNCCEHSKEEYICSFIEQSKKNQHGHSILESGEKYDFYLYQDIDGYHGICLRYGNECSEYISPGHVYEYMLRYEDQASCYGDHYSVVAWILKYYGKFEFKWK